MFVIECFETVFAKLSFSQAVSISGAELTYKAESSNRALQCDAGSNLCLRI
jgi:hypothetical protein